MFYTVYPTCDVIKIDQIVKQNGRWLLLLFRYIQKTRPIKYPALADYISPLRLIGAVTDLSLRGCYQKWTTDITITSKFLIDKPRKKPLPHPLNAAFYFLYWIKFLSLCIILVSVTFVLFYNANSGLCRLWELWITITITILFSCFHLPIGVSKSSEKGIDEIGRERSVSTVPFHWTRCKTPNRLATNISFRLIAKLG